MGDITQGFLYRQRKCLTLMGHILTQNLKASRWNQIQQFFWIFFVVSAQYPLLYNAYYHRRNVELVTASLSISFTNMLTIIKIGTFFVNKNMFLELMDDLKNMWQSCDHYASNFLKTANIMVDRVVNFYFYSVACTGIYFMTGPLVKMAWGWISNQPIVVELPMPLRFFFDAEKMPGYIYGYVYTGFSTISVVMHAVAIDGLFISFAIHLRSHFRLLQHYIETNTFSKTDIEINADICSFVKYHTKILKLTDRMCLAYKPIIFGEFLTTSLEVCVIVYQVVTHMNNPLLLLVNITFLVSILVQLLLYCYGGDILRLESVMVATSVQLSKWYRLSPKYRKMMCLLMSHSQKEVVIQAGFYEASLANFLAIVKAAVSYITIIQSLE